MTGKQGHNYEHWIETFLGHPIDPLNPEPKRIYLHDIAHALSNQCRFSGHTKSFYCPTEGQRVLTADLQWVAAGDLKIGQRLLGFDELPHERGSAGNRRRKYRPSRVTHTQKVKRQIIRLEMSDGSTAISSAEHPWLVATKNSRNQEWMTAEHIAADIHIGRKRYMHKFIEPWKFESSRRAGWLAGMYDGEGYLGIKNRTGTQMGIAQKPGLIWDEINQAHKQLGFSGIRYCQTGLSGCMTLQLHGGWREIARLLGSIRPIRLLDKFQSALENGHFNKQLDGAKAPLEIVSAYREKDQWVAGLETSTHTYICEGYAAHNSVSQHSVHVSNLVRSWGKCVRTQVLALYHDASEAYLQDMPTPIKRQMPAYREAEDRLQRMIEDTLFPEFSGEHPEKKEETARIIKKADLVLLATEARDLMGNPKDWKVLQGVEPLKGEIVAMSPERSKDFFLARHHELVSRLQKRAVRT